MNYKVLSMVKRFLIPIMLLLAGIASHVSLGIDVYREGALFDNIFWPSGLLFLLLSGVSFTIIFMQYSLRATVKRFLVPTIFLLVGVLFLCIQYTAYGYVDENGVLRDSIFLPLGALSMLMGAGLFSIILAYTWSIVLFKGIRNYRIAK